MSSQLLLAGAGAPTFRTRWIPLSGLLARLPGGFTKDAGNPVLPKGSSGAWDDWGVRDFAILTDEKGLIVYKPDGIWAYYWGRPDSSGVIRIGLAKSIDHGLTWARYGSNPIISGSGVGGSWYENGIATGAAILERDGMYRLIATGWDGSNVNRTGVLTSFDGINWTDNGAVLSLSDFDDGGTPVIEGASGLTLIKRSAGDYLAVGEFRINVANAWRIFGATALDFLGPWTPLNSGQPLLSPTGAGWESVGVANPHVIEAEPGQYLMAYNGISASTGWQIGFASGSTLTALTRYAGNPVLTKGAGGQWDDQQVEASGLFRDPTMDQLRLYYQGYSAVDGSMQVGLATAG